MLGSTIGIIDYEKKPIPSLTLRSFPKTHPQTLQGGCQGRLAAAALLQRCRRLLVGDVASLINEAHEAHTEKVRSRTAAASAQPHSFSKNARAAALARARELGCFHLRDRGGPGSRGELSRQTDPPG